MIPQLTMTTLGLTTFILLMSEWFEVLRWIGVTYLLYLGYKYWITAADPLETDPKKLKFHSPRTVYLQGFLTSATNPKTLMFFGAFLPQFITPAYDVLTQMIILSLTLIIVVAFIDAGWAFLAGGARVYLSKIAHLRNKIAAVFFLTSGAALALVKRQ